MNTVKELLDRVKEATGPDRELDLAIWNATNTHPSHWHRSFPSQTVVEHNKYGEGAVGNPVYTLDEFTASIDGALALTERVLPGWVTHMHTGDDSLNHMPPWARVVPANNDDAGWQMGPKESHAPSIPLAILAATLSAVIAQGDA